MAGTLIALFFLSASAAQAGEEKNALVLFDLPKEVAIAARSKLAASLASAGHALAGLERTRALFEGKEVGRLSSAEIEAVRTAAGLEKLILIDSAVPPKAGAAVYRIRIFSGDEPQLRFQATAGADQEAVEVLTDSVVQLVNDWTKGRPAAH
jgi:hypothetical protein